MPEDVHPQIQVILDTLAEAGIPKLQDLSTRDARALVESLSVARRESYPPPEVSEVHDLTTGPDFGSVPVRLYRTSSHPKAPVIVFFHGGGHVVGSPDSYDTTARFLARSCACTLVSVDYRMGPDHPFPAAVEDCYNATRWVHDTAGALQVDPDQLVVCGDSAGGNLAAVIALMARDSGTCPVAAQVLIYPVIDYRGQTPSYDRYGTGYGVLETETVDWFRAGYLPDPARHDDWRACPRNAASHTGLPPALVITAVCDVLHDEGVAYAAQMAAAGVPVSHHDFPGMTHGFFSYLGLVDDAERAHAMVAGFVRRIAA